MSRAAFLSACAFALALGLAFRLTSLDARPMHHDEANQAVKFGALLERAGYRYDPNDHHGPTLYYLTLPAAWLRGQATLASLDERTLRAVPAAFGAGLILLVALLGRGLGRRAAAAGALLAAVSPALVYYSRFYIQESLLAFFGLAFVIALGRYLERPGLARASAAGLFAGLAYATKETSVILVAAALAAAAAARWSGGAGERAPGEARPGWRDLGAAACTAAAGAFLFHSSFLANPGGFVESILAFSVYLHRGVDATRHAQPWDYYLRTLGWSSSGGLRWTEAFILALAALGTAWAFLPARAPRFWPRYLALYAWLTALIFSALRYKTPWNVLPFHAGLVVMAGVGVAVIWRTGDQAEGAEAEGGEAGGGQAAAARARGETRRRVRLRSVAALALLAAGATHLGVQAWRASTRYGADPRNPYVYAQTSPDFLRLVARVRALSAVHPDGKAMLVKVFAGPYEQWPLPWYLRDMTRVGYWADPAGAESVEAPVVIASEEHLPAVESALDGRYVSEFYGLRPGVLLGLWIDRDLWERFLETRR